MAFSSSANNSFIVVYSPLVVCMNQIPNRLHGQIAGRQLVGAALQFPDDHFGILYICLLYTSVESLHTINLIAQLEVKEVV